LRPRGSFIGVNDAIMGSIRFHCSFVSSILILLHNQAFMSRFILRSASNQVIDIYFHFSRTPEFSNRKLQL
jgi:hypothetical protein